MGGKDEYDHCTGEGSVSCSTEGREEGTGWDDQHSDRKYEVFIVQRHNRGVATHHSPSSPCEVNKSTLADLHGSAGTGYETTTSTPPMIGGQH